MNEPDCWKYVAICHILGGSFSCALGVVLVINGFLYAMTGQGIINEKMGYTKTTVEESK